MTRKVPPQLSRRERQMMDVVYRRGSATAAEIRADLEDPPSYSTVRTLLKVLVDKGHLKHKQEGPRYVYSPTVPAERARRSALNQLLTTFFEGSAEKAMATLIEMSSTQLSSDELNHLAEMIETAKQGEKE